MNLRKYLFTSSFITAMAVIFVLLIAAGCTVILEKQDQLNHRAVSVRGDINLVGNDRDNHGCIGSAGYTWCEPKQKCLRIWEENCYLSLEQEIQYSLSQKYQKPFDQITVTVTKSTEGYAVGKIAITTPNLPAGGPGGLFLAAREGNVWTLVYDGNGSINCVDIRQRYAFPADMLRGFCD